jgi:subtilisin family serine protease
MAKKKAEQFVLLPGRGMEAASMRSEALVLNLPEAAKAEIRILDEIRPDGAKLVELAPQAVATLRAHRPGLRLVPLVYYRPAVLPRAEAAAPAKKAAGAALTLRVISSADGKPVANAVVVAFTDFEGRVGAQGKTNKSGVVKLALGAKRKKVERLYIYPEAGFWSLLRKDAALADGGDVELQALDLAAADELRFFYGSASEESGAGVAVGVVDTGIDVNHPDLRVDGGANTVVGEDPSDFGDNGARHGTHVAGIIAARGAPPEGLRGIAPGVKLRSYRVFGKGAEGASNYAIAKAIDRAVADGCDLINMSLGGGGVDEATRAAIEDARARGTAVLAAAGNDGRQAVSFPASDSMALAISAMGRVGTFPSSATEAGEVALPKGADPKNFIAAFSNVGPETDLTGPGVGIVSTVPGGYGVMSGTSMACPAAAGAAARLLAARADILGMPRGQARSDAMVALVLQAAKSMGFGASFEGSGLLPG